MKQRKTKKIRLANVTLQEKKKKKTLKKLSQQQRQHQRAQTVCWPQIHGHHSLHAGHYNRIAAQHVSALHCAYHACLLKHRRRDGNR